MRWFGWFRRRPVETDTIANPIARYRYTFTGHDETLDQAARQRRHQADAIRKDAIRVEQQTKDKTQARVVSLRLSARQDLPRRATGR